MEDQEGGRGGTGRRKGLKIPSDPLISQDIPGNNGASDPAEKPANPAGLETPNRAELRTFQPDPFIVHQLAEVRRRAKAGALPAFARGQMFYDFRAGRVRIGAAP